MEHTHTKTTRAALVLGASGGVGGALVEALAVRGWRVRGMARDPEAAAAGWCGRKGEIAWTAGDAMRRGDVVRAAEGVEVIVHAVNPPGYATGRRSLRR